ncbi:two-component system response regulator DesR [Arthrobacter stackebrandtii]|uniref:Two-component system response regulator DesR n=1 Tax=Arthrobacter stackebrandtii TaxID=272161 RepID=A0ABS4YS61_9MICC|nr:two-component system response regulator DesR [Arthrobacter stackebrandtii]
MTASPRPATRRSLAVAGAVGSAVVLWLVGFGLLGLDPEVGSAGQVQEVNLASTVAVPLLAGLAAWGLLALLERRGAKGVRAWRIIGTVFLAVPGIAVLVVTTFGRPGYLRRALDAGARGFLVKDDPVEELAAAIRAVLAGETVVNPGLAAQSLRDGPNPLTGRERDTLAAGAGGATIVDIARTLQLSTSTVRNYLSSAIGKTGTRNRTEALTLARERGWL